MESILHYGRSSQIRLDVADETLVAYCDGPRGAPIESPSLAIELALESPLDFPPLSQAITPGDRVTIALGQGVPRVAELLPPVVQALLGCGVSPDMITVLRAPSPSNGAAEDPRAGLSSELKEAISLVEHLPTSRNEHAYLATTAEGRTIHLNRVLCEADVVIPIACMQSGPAGGSYGAGLYPTFSTQETIERYRNPSLANSDSEIAERARHEANEVAWLLGVLFAIQTVPGQGGTLLSVVAGMYEAATRRADELYREAWNFSVPQRAGLVVAAIEGDDSEQTWENVGRAIAAASHVVADEGIIAVLSEVAIEPGEGVRRVHDFENPRQALRELRKVRPVDVFPAIQLARALSRARVYFHSRLSEGVIEELGMAPVDEAEDIARLASRHSSCVVLSNAQHTVAMTSDHNS